MPSRAAWYILAPTFAVSGLLLAVGMSGAWYVHSVNRNVSISLDRILAETQFAERLVLTLRDVRLKLHAFVNDKDVGRIDDAQTTLAMIIEELERDSGLNYHGKPGDKILLVRLEDFGQQLQTLRQIPGDRAMATLQIEVLENQLLAPAEQVLKSRQQLATNASLENQAIADRIGVGLLLLGVSGAVAGILVGFAMARSLHRSLVEITVPVRDIAGQLNEVVGPIKVATNTNLSDLDGALRTLADKTSDVVRQLQTSQQETLRSEQLAAVGQLAAGLAHELRNPLMPVKLLVQTARERGDGSLTGRDLAVIEDEVGRLEKMLQTFLDFARPAQPEQRVMDFRSLVNDTVEFIRPRADQLGVNLHLSAPGNELNVAVDEAQMRQVLLNLLFNALDALPDGGNVWLVLKKAKGTGIAGRAAAVVHSGQSSLRAHASQPNEWVLFRIADDGPGIQAGVIGRVFEPFVSTKDTGIGLGLSISRRIVESHGGSIYAANRATGGAEFTIWLRCDKELTDPGEDNPKPYQASNGAPIPSV